MNEDIIKIEITSTANIKEMLEECRYKIDKEVAKLNRPPKNSDLVQDIRLVSINGNLIQYKVFWRPSFHESEKKYL